MNSLEIYSTLVSKCPAVAKNMHYLKRYMEFIIQCSNQKQTTDVEVHHILPKADNLWPEYTNLTQFSWNAVALTKRQHRLAHWMLARTFGGTMWFAFNMMKSRASKPLLQSTSDEISKNLDSSTWVKLHWQDDEARKLHIANMVKSWTEERRVSHGEAISASWTDERKAKQSSERTGDLNQFKGKHHTDETKELLASMYRGTTLSDETKHKISASTTGERNHFKHKHHTDESKAKFRATILSKPLIECPHCLKSSRSPANMKRYHFDACKSKPDPLQSFVH